jgi:hypothetical protein
MLGGQGGAFIKMIGGAHHAKNVYQSRRAGLKGPVFSFAPDGTFGLVALIQN